MLVDPAPGPERTLAAEQELALVVGLLSAVSERVCRIFVAQRMGYSHDEIATAFGIMPRTVEKHVVSAGSALREIMPDAFSRSARR
jgi:RNA polymerase sigma-70 factor (ECF subfamily)